MPEIIIQRDVIAPIDHQVTTIEQYQMRRLMRRRRVAKRMAKRCPMFAVELCVFRQPVEQGSIE